MDSGLSTFLSHPIASYVSMELVGGTSGTIGHSNVDPTLAETHAFSPPNTSTSGAVQLVLRTAPTFVGAIDAGSFVRGTGTTSSNRVLVAVAPCAAGLPPTGTSGVPIAPLRAAGTLMFVGLIVLLAGVAVAATNPQR